MNLEQRVDNLDKDVRDLRTEVTNLRVDVTDIKARVPYLATKEEVAHSRNVIIYWLIGLFVATGIYNHFSIFDNQHHLNQQQYSLEQTR